MTDTDDFRYEGKPSCAITKSTLFALSKDEWDTKEYTSNSIVHTAVCQKASVGPKRRQTVKIKPVALAVIYACLKASVSQLLTQSVENSIR